MLGSFSEFEHNVITERTTEGGRRKAEDGGHACGEIPFGHRKNGNGQLRPDLDTVPTVRWIFGSTTKGRVSDRSSASSMTTTWIRKAAGTGMPRRSSTSWTTHEYLSYISWATE